MKYTPENPKPAVWVNPNQDAINHAHKVAHKGVPTENGFFDARKRLAVFMLEMLFTQKISVHAFIEEMSDNAVDSLLQSYELDLV